MSSGSRRGSKGLLAIAIAVVVGVAVAITAAVVVGGVGGIVVIVGVGLNRCRPFRCNIRGSGSNADECSSSTISIAINGTFSLVAVSGRDEGNDDGMVSIEI